MQGFARDKAATGLPGSAGSGAHGPLARVVYVSRAIHPMADPALLALTHAAASRNRAEHVTGVVLYADSHFYQWLEGPVAAVDRILESITRDDRHADIHVVEHQRIRRRTFGAWSMQLASASMSDAATRRNGLTRAPAGLVEALRDRPEDAALLLADLSCLEGTGTAELLRELLLDRVLPVLVSRHGLDGAATREPLPASHRRLTELVAALAIADLDATTRLLMSERLAVPASRTGGLFAALVEPAARELGNLWGDESLSAPDVTAGLACLRTGLRHTARVASGPPVVAHGQRVLSAALPFEPHAIGHVVHPLLLAGSGTEAEEALPGPACTLLARVSNERFDVLDLSLSAAFTETERFGDARTLISEVRRASRNPSLAIVVSGRAAAMGLARPLHADAESRSAQDLPAAIRRAAAARQAA